MAGGRLCSRGLRVRPRALHDEPLRGPGDDGGEDGLRKSGEAAQAPDLATPSRSSARRRSGRQQCVIAAVRRWRSEWVQSTHSAPSSSIEGEGTLRWCRSLRPYTIWDASRKRATGKQTRALVLMVG
jgi:hypothetical protein